MSGPKRSLCPRCGTRPRYRAGTPCLPCKVALLRERRHAARAPDLRAVPVFDRPLHATRYLVTSAQNATPVHAPFFAALQVAAKHLNAEILVVPLRYRNPTSRWTQAQDDDDWWADELKPYLFSVRRKLHRHLVLAADVRVQPTASSPLAGFEGLTGAESLILGHPKMAFRSVASPTGRYPKVLSTTGSITQRNYVDSKAGALGSFHHYLGALLVELDRGRFHLRQINADRKTGAFTDLDQVYSPDGVTAAPPAAALVLGDVHARWADPAVDRATWGPGGIVETLLPARVVVHDLVDNHTSSPHHTALHRVANAKAGLASVSEEIREAYNWISTRYDGSREMVVVPSNHNDFLTRWINGTDWRSDPANAVTYLETALALARSARVGPGGVEWDDPLAAILAGVARVLRPGESYSVLGIELGMHGHQGPNGTRGTLRNLARLGARVVTGHSHTPGIEEGHYQVGTSSVRDLEYVRGPSSWLQTHCAVYASGARCLLTMVDGRWRK